MKLLKKTFALILSLILVVGMIPGSLMTAYAAGTSGGGFKLSGDTAEWNVSISDAGVLSWDDKGSGYTYTISVAHYGTGGTVTHIEDLSTNSCNLKAKFEERKIESGYYYFLIEAKKGGSTISTGVYDMNMYYVSALPKLSEPQDLKWDGSKATWDSVPNATGYTVYLYAAHGSLHYQYDVTDTQRDFGAAATDGRWFEVVATADGYRNSNAAESPKFGTASLVGGGFRLSGDTAEWNVSISDAGVLSWDDKGSGYTYTISVAHYGTGGTVTHIEDLSTNSCNLKAKFEERKIESGYYYFLIEAKKGGSTISTGVYDMNMYYVSALPKLSEPQDLKWDGSKATWDSVPNATGYTVYLYAAHGSLHYQYDVTDTQRDFGAAATDGRWFEVVANADGYRNSNAAESPKYGEVVTPPVDTTINIVEATVKEPEAGETPANATVNTTGAKIFSTDWYDGDTQLDADDKFESGKTYKCVVIVHPEDGYKFADSVTLEINGEAAPIVASESDYINAFVKFEVETLPSVITELNATVVEPSIGGTPATTATTTGTDYTVSVSWWLEDATAFDETSFDGVFTGTSFEENVSYGVAIKFTAEEGKTIASEPTVTINGKTAHLLSYSLDGTAVMYYVKFDKLVDTVIDELNATVTEPAIGAAPATTATTTGTDYTVSVSWWLEDATAFDETSFDGVFTGTSFEENVSYGVAIKFTAEEGKTIASEPTVTINGKTAHLLSYSLDGTAVMYYVKFDKLEAETPVPTEYDITVNGGTASANKAVAGTSITLTAEQIDGKVFSHWEVNGATVSDANAKETTFTMGNADVTAEAIYDDCECKCHKGGIVGFFYKIVLFFQKLFGNNLVCNCGKKH